MTSELGIVGLQYIPNFITQDQANYLIDKIDGTEWLDDLKRRVQHYGYKYDYRARVIDDSMNLGPIPQWLTGVRGRLVNTNIFAEMPDQIIVNEYEPGQGIAAHIDCTPCFENVIASLSLGSGCNFDFTRGDEKRTVRLEPNSLVVIEGEARYQWMHGIARRISDDVGGEKVPRNRRVSLTFRRVILI